MALLRILLLGLLVLLVVRLAVRLLNEIARRRRPPRAATRRDGSDRSRPGRKRQLVACPVCGTYFEEHRGLPVDTRWGRGERFVVCSQACRESPPGETSPDETSHGPRDSPSDGGGR